MVVLFEKTDPTRKPTHMTGIQNGILEQIDHWEIPEYPEFRISRNKSVISGVSIDEGKLSLNRERWRNFINLAALFNC